MGIKNKYFFNFALPPNVLDSYKKYKKETQVIIGISAIPIGQIRMTNESASALAGMVPHAFIPMWQANQ